MALQSTTKIRLFVLSSEEEKVLQFLQTKGVMEITKTREDVRSDVSHSAEFALSELDFAISYLSSYQPEKTGLRNSVLGEKIEVSESERSKLLESTDWKQVVEELRALQVSNTDAERKLSEVEVSLSEVGILKNTTVSAFSGRFSSLFFSLSARSEVKLKKDIEELSPLIDVQVVSRDEKTIGVCVVMHANILEKVRQLFQLHLGKELVVENGVSPNDIFVSLEKKKTSLELLLENNKKRSIELLSTLDSLKIIYDEFASEKEIEVSLRKVSAKDFISVVEGWVPSSEVKVLENSLSRKFNKAIAVEEIEKQDKEISRVILNPSNFMAPIMEITKMFGTPKIEEVDPTPYYAFFFLLFFGFCLTDAGYGIILFAMTSFILMLKLPFEKSVTDVIRMFQYGGVSTIVMGVLFGGWFGLTPDQVPEFLTYETSEGSRLFLGQIFDPMVDLVDKIMPLAYILGVLHLSLGLFLSGLIAWKAGDRNRMLFVTIPMISIFVFASLTWGLGVDSFIYMFYLSIVLAMWGIGASGNPVLRLLKGAGGLLNESLGWFSNILSYSRLFALGLATGIIAMSFNIVAMTLGAMVPGAMGVVVMLLVLAFGHILNIALNVLGAYVHSSRLQFVEFFGMFLEGGGRVLKPLRKVCRFRHTS